MLASPSGDRAGKVEPLDLPEMKMAYGGVCFASGTDDFLSTVR